MDNKMRRSSKLCAVKIKSSYNCEAHKLGRLIKKEHGCGPCAFSRCHTDMDHSDPAFMKQETVHIKDEQNEVEVHSIQIKEDDVEMESLDSGTVLKGDCKKQILRPQDIKPVLSKLEPDPIHAKQESILIKTEPILDSECQTGKTKKEHECFEVKKEDQGDGSSDLKGDREEAYDEHRTDSESPPQFFPCPHCVVSFTGSSYLEKHLKWTHQLQYQALLRSRASKVEGSPEALERHSCPDCGLGFPLRRQLAVHARRQHPSTPPQKRHPCPQCPRSFHYLASLQKHCKQWHQLATVCRDGRLTCASCGEGLGTLGGPHVCPGSETKAETGPTTTADGSFLCSVCSKTCSTMQNLRVHMRTHTGERPYTCTDCGKCFAERGSLAKHVRIHTGVKPFKCPDCGKQFGRMSHLTSHRLTHSGEKPFVCGECTRRFTHKADLKTHQRTHSGEKPFRCPDCGKDFAIMGNLRAHQRVHSKEKSHQCGECGRKFGEAAVLKKHLRTHTGERPYHCTACGKQFNRVQHLKTHQRTHTGEKPYRCGDCGKSFSQSGDLTKHRRTHTGERPYACPDCERTYSNSGDLRKHSRSHTGQRPYSCQECGKSFRMIHHLKVHVRTHTGERPYSCPQCPLSFSRPHHLSSHLKVHWDATQRSTPAERSISSSAHAS
ncbi:zinc finger protein ZFP2 [Brienomyrus brachyistius]|uniref:zinc finger protein ZFP2 n=1 Tax=Brienomyrus brachyistius TaxID=42636 RepID=UPI0020B19AE0|nr:zinc finger protein ZFP2 [Brienomyrus brachyistius]